MNKIRVKIINVAKSGGVALVKLNAVESNTQLTALVIDFNDNLVLGVEYNAIFKESEVMIAMLHSHVSARNCFKAHITQIECDDIFARIFMDFSQQVITSLITKEAMIELNLKVGDEILWFVKSNEVMLEFK